MFKASLAVVTLALLAACASMEADLDAAETNPMIEQARQAYIELSAKEGLSQSGTETLADAKAALEKAEQLHNRKVKTQLVNDYAQLSLKLSSVALDKQNISEARSRLSAATKEIQGTQIVPASLTKEVQEGLQESQDGRGQVLTIGDVLFEFNSAELTPGGADAIARIAEVLQRYPDRNILIEGYTDDSGPADVNRSISQQRAENVRQMLVELGAAEDKLGAIGLGEYYPIADNNHKSGRIQNRRVEVIIPPS